ncbi:MAG: LysR family transcriptional regulator [Burkholderiaceae bacterium]
MKRRLDTPLSLRLRVGDDARIGPGKVALLEAIAGGESLLEAAGRLQMSSRRAWLLIDAMHQAFGRPLVVLADEPASAPPDDPGAAPVRLSAFGAAVLTAYQAVQAEAARAMARHFDPLLRDPIPPAGADPEHR